MEHIYNDDIFINMENYRFSMKFMFDGTIQLMTHPARFEIIQCLRAHKEGLYVEQIAKEISKSIDIHPRMVSHHLDVLEERGLVKCRYQISKETGSKRGVAIRICTATPKADEVISEMKEI